MQMIGFMEIERSELAQTVIGAAIEVHSALGPGLLESAYDRCLAHELQLRGLTFVRQRRLPIDYKGISLNYGYRVDFVVEGALVLELKTVDRLLPVHKSQLFTYLRLLQVRQGLLLNFHVEFMRDGIKSVLCPLREASQALS